VGVLLVGAASLAQAPEPPRKPKVAGWAATRVEERMGRGVVAVRRPDGSVYVGWRLLKDDPADVAFNVYRADAEGEPVKLHADPILATTDYVDRHAPHTEAIEGGRVAYADVLGDWREEIIASVAGELRIYTTTIPAQDRRVCLMQDSIHRIDVAHLAMGYGQPPMTTQCLSAAR